MLLSHTRSSDPLHTRTDAELLSILQHSHLLPPPGKSDPAAEARFTLDASLGHEGVGLSAGEKQQLALCRVLVKQSKIIILVCGDYSFGLLTHPL